LNPLYFLDTNILVHLVRDDATGQYINKDTAFWSMTLAR